MLGNMVKMTFNMIWGILKYPLLIVGIAATILFLIYIGWSLYYKIFKGCKTSGTHHYPVKK